MRSLGTVFGAIAVLTAALLQAGHCLVFEESILEVAA